MISARSVLNRLAGTYQAPRKRRIAVFVLCVLGAYGVWVAVRGQPIPGTAEPLWAMPEWAKALLLSGMALALFGLFRLGGRFIRDARSLYVLSSAVRSSGDGVRWYRYLNPVGPFYNLYLHRNLLRQFVRREVASRYEGSYLGIALSLVEPLLLLTMYTFVFSFILKLRWASHPEATQATFAVMLFPGLIAYFFLAECVNHAPILITAHPNYVKKVVFPLEVLLASTVGSALFQGMVSVVILLAGEVLILGTIPPTIVLLPVVLLPLIALCLGLSFFLASVGVYIRDSATVIRVAVQVLFHLTPIYWQMEAVPEAARPFLRLNPLAEIVESFRRVLVWNQLPNWGSWLAVTVASGVILLLGYTWFMKTKAGFADVL